MVHPSTSAPTPSHLQHSAGPNQLPKEALPLFQDVNSTVKAPPAPLRRCPPLDASPNTEPQALVVLKGANHCQWTNPTAGGVCAHAECHDIDRPTQQAGGRELVGAFLPTIGQAPDPDPTPLPARFEPWPKPAPGGSLSPDPRTARALKRGGSLRPS